VDRKEQVRSTLREGDRSAGRSRGKGRRAFGAFPPARYITIAAAAIALGQLDAVAAVYTREIGGAIPTSGSLTADVIEALPGWILAIEQTRQAAALLVVLAVAVLAGRTALEGIGAFLFGIGLWTVARYAGLKLMIEWPPSSAAQDVLTMIPRAVFAPVWAIVLGACAAVAVGVLCLRGGRRG
jgi:hypothetical protein